MDVIELTKNLIQIPSITGEEQDILLYLEEVLLQNQFTIEKQVISPGRWNLFADWQNRTDIVFCTHVDTVPPFIPFQSDSDFIFGRGSCDTKAIIAAMIQAGVRLKQEGETPSFLFVVGEETDSVGAKTAAKSGKRSSYIVVGEPTDNVMAAAHNGILSYSLHTQGKAAHSAYPDMGHSAIESLLEVLYRIRNHNWGTHPVLGTATLNIGEIQGGVALNVFAPHASARLIHRLVDNAVKRRKELELLVGTAATISIHSVAEPQFLHTLPGYTVKTVHYGTDIPYLSSMGRCLLIGPGSIHDAHTDQEKIRIDDIHHAVEIYYSLYYQLKHEVEKQP